MKKFFVAVALVMGLGTTVAFAENLTSGVETVMAVNDFTPIEVKDLPAAVTEAIAKNFAESTVKEAAVEAAVEVLLEPPQAVRARAAAETPAAARKLRREIFFIIVFLLMCLFLHSGSASRRARAPFIHCSHFSKFF